MNGMEKKRKIEIHNFSIHYGAFAALRHVDLTIYDREILGIIGPANSGKTSLMRSLNRLNDQYPDYRHDGTIMLDGSDIYEKMAASLLRKRVGMIFALPAPLPLSIYDNITYGPMLHGIKSRPELEGIVESTLKAAFLWEEVKDRLAMPAMKLSGGQQQRLCIARSLAVDPEVILYDEPCSGLDPISTAKVEEAMTQLSERYTQILVTNNTKQAARVSDRTAFFLTGEMVEVDDTNRIFTNPRDRRTEDYVSGRFG